VSASQRQWLLAPGLRLELRHTGDRWTHGISIAAGPARPFVLVAASVEGDLAHPDPRRVVSPVYQDLRDHAVPEGECVLLTGQATPHHFSAVLTARCDGPSAVVAVDAADRCRGPIDALAATYVLPLGSSALVDATADQIVWGGAALGDGRLELAVGAAGTLALAEGGRQATRVQALARLAPETHTQRLIYCWRWTPPP
jgi:hypothetical protein